MYSQSECAHDNMINQQTESNERLPSRYSSFVFEVVFLVNDVTVKSQLQFCMSDYLLGNIPKIDRQVDTLISRQNYMNYLSDFNTIATAASNYIINRGFVC